MRAPSLRQMEALIAFVEAGTVSRAADALRISQPAASKLLSSLELDTEMQLFERDGRRLALSAQGMRLYEEVERIFTGVHQFERAVDAIRREGRGRLIIGVLPALSGSLICRAIMGFLDRHPDVYVSVIERSSQFISDWLVRGQLDIGIVSTHTNEARINSEPLSVQPLICVVSKGHRLAERGSIDIKDIDEERFIAFSPNNIIRIQIDNLFESHEVKLNVVADADTAKNACELVVAGLGVTVVHPLTVPETLRGQVSILKLEPSATIGFHLCSTRECRNKRLVDAFIEDMRKVSAESLSCLWAASGDV